MLNFSKTFLSSQFEILYTLPISGEDNRNEIDTKREENTLEKSKENPIHYISWAFGLLLSCGYVSLITLVPGHNILKEPYYWYELMIFAATGANSISVALFILELAYWANISYAKNWTTFFIMFSFGAIIVISIDVTYFLIWTYHLGLYAPMPLNYFITGMSMFFGLEALLWFR